MNLSILQRTLYSLLVLAGAWFAYFHYANFMDVYEVGILWATSLVLIVIGWRWVELTYLVIGIGMCSLTAIWLYQGDLSHANSLFMLKFLLSSQSSIVWMNTLFVLAMLSYWGLLLGQSAFLGRVASALTWSAVLMGFVGLMVRWYESYLIDPEAGHIPLSNLYEVFIIFCLVTALLYLQYEKRLRNRQLGGFVLLIINLAVGFILWYTYSRHANGIQPLVPALQSYWMKIHVPANFIGYGAFSIAAMVSVAYLLVTHGILKERLPSLLILDELIYQSIAVGFGFFTIATILGAMWAAEAWGGYWSWDPKETWALIVWLNYAAWLHLRLVKGIRGSLLAYWALIGLLVTSFAFLGVNMFLSGLHSYGTL